MGKQSQEGHIGFKTQAVEATYLDPGGAGTGGEPHAGHFMKVLSTGLSGNRDLMIPDPEIGGNRDIQDARLGPIAYSGDIEFYGRFDAIGTLITAALGAVSSVPAGITFDTDMDGVHTITPTDTVANLPFLSIEEAIAGDYDVFNYTDARVNTLAFTADADGYAMGTVGIIAKTQTAGETATTPITFDPTPLIAGAEITVNWNSADVEARDFSFDFSNNIEDDVFALGQVGLSSLVPKRREITMGFTVRPDLATEFWREATYGSAAATTPGTGAAVKRALVITMLSSTLDPAGNPFQLKITCPSATIQPFSIDPSGDDVLEHSFDIQIFRPLVATPAVTIELTNRYPAIR